jgi:hypothetical protein
VTRFALALWLLASLHPAISLAAETEDGMPAPPAAAPPRPADLAGPGPAAPAPAPPALRGLPPGFEALPDGGARLRLPTDSAGLPPAAERSIAELGRRIAAGEPGRVTVTAQASGPAADVSTARRLTLERALAVKQALAAGGLPTTRIDLRPMGRTDEALDAVDIQPPGPAR